MSPTWFSATKNVDEILGAAETILDGAWIKPVKRPKTVVAAIPIKIPPGTLRTIKTAVITKPKIVSHVVPTLNEPSATRVESSETIIPPSLNPKKAMK